ncbi:cytochrome c-type biogenesis protein [Pectobacterium carotovorum]|uniref:Cytochrome c-type biogenesis protein n=1 Tax=Pectobacterium carotovorum subsp. carotovorum TaxID=555 RepID=A0AAI9KXK7_PECCC|nr:cytochrome c-type biogenesis protein [Pectobacterium carotovorum]MBL0868610.1 cytochrome c-type biogenesis protein CcmH [Pectobacterium carotovorum]MCA6969625.1 cytochrome c-type biogenesis protein CcmH [Pectobacterium carotovorum]QHP57992.1 cytochrome c-type biogenesis protein CcmH [Pectobacterium carotovorum subsp. carotovorum]ULS51564.1 cytochrome c-type biogenesis protein CcmH [Pectobacterium carotovorum]GKV89050.1 cytochrome c-type biogenesis protein CcmH [Pectobacterium carotovorum su
MRVIGFLSALLLSFSVLASSEVLRFDNDTQEQQFRELTMQLRCPKCQNNSIADSNSMIASDMRQKVYELMQQGQTKEQVVDYMVDRYGYFVTYEPPITPFTVLLWLLPALFLAVGSWVIIRRARRIRSAKEPMSEQDKKRLQTLLDREGKSE